MSRTTDIVNKTDLREKRAFYSGISIMSCLLALLFSVLAVLFFLSGGHAPGWFYCAATLTAGCAVVTAGIVSLAYRRIYRNVLQDARQQIDQTLKGENVHVRSQHGHQ